MCLANTYDEITKAILMENTKTIDVDGDTVILKDLFGQEKRIRGSLLHIDLEENRVIIKTSP